MTQPDDINRTEESVRADDARAIPLISYSAISLALLLPLIFWPGQIDPDLPLIDQEIYRLWLINGTILLLAGVTADTVLRFRSESLWPILATFWILLAGIGISIALRSSFGPWLLALLFAIHSLRAALPLWRNQQQWWLWPAWIRDTLAAISVFAWIALLV